MTTITGHKQFRNIKIIDKRGGAMFLGFWITGTDAYGRKQVEFCPQPYHHVWQARVQARYRRRPSGRRAKYSLNRLRSCREPKR